MSTYSTSEFSPADAFKAPSNLNKPVQQHLIKVYGTLCGLSVIAGLGVYAHVYGLFFFGGGLVSFLFGIAALVGIMSMPNTPENKLTRYGLLGVFGFMEGLSIGPVVKYALAITYFLYLGGILGSVLSLLLWTSFINSFVGSKFIFDIEIYVGLLMFSGYDEISDALTLFIDLVGIFVRILSIFADKSENGNQRQKERRSRRKAGYSGQ
ncbi:5024_t:CDS:2 [Diversispora eburnea]|uniref:5024_t:CDS:1 n=1 Tax=Diversispora eburnea TaxID=1213867 RepID=A0A9N8YUG7_9GLOM|nr:5024_t:CDS:2 [Diversispora eburnea]